MTIPSEQRMIEANRMMNRAGMLNTSTKRTLADRWYDAALDLARRSQAGTASYDGFGSGGYVEIRNTEDPERLTPLEAHMNRLIEHKADRPDPVHALAERLCNAYTEAAANLKIVEQCLELIDKLSTPGKGIGQTVAMCTTVGGHEQLRDIPCGEQVSAKGLCKQCYNRLSYLNALAAEEGRPQRSALSKQEADEVFAKRGKQRVHVDPTSPHAQTV